MHMENNYGIFGEHNMQKNAAHQDDVLSYFYPLQKDYLANLERSRLW